MIDNPTLVVAPIALMITVAMFQTVLMRSDVKHRAEAVIDPLTGMLNRNALARRAEELAQQSLVTRQPIGLIAGDIDHFKAINDTHGHAAGDAVLADVADRAAHHAARLRPLLPHRRRGVRRPAAGRRPRARHRAGRGAARRRRPGAGGRPRRDDELRRRGLAPDEGFDYETVFGAADAALYEAKHSGRNRVCPPPAVAALAA